MSGIGDFLTGALGGAGAGVASVASRYVDEEIQQRRAQALAELQHQTMVRGEEYMQSAPVQERRVSNERNLLRARNEEALSADVARATNQPLRQAKIDERVEFLRGTTPAEVEAQNAITEGTAGAKLDAERMRAKVMTPLEIERARGIADAQVDAGLRLQAAKTAGKGSRMSEAAELEYRDLNKQDADLQKTINDAIVGGTLKMDPKDPAWQHMQRQRQAIAVKKLRVQAREGLISGSEDAASLIATGATPAELEASVKQAQLIGGTYASDFSSAVREQLAKSREPKPAPAPQPGAAPGPAPAAANLVEQRRTERQPAPPGSPQAKWDARQQELRAQSEAKTAERAAAEQRALSAFDADLQSLEPIELVRKYSTPSSRAGLDRARLARLNSIERSL